MTSTFRTLLAATVLVASLPGCKSKPQNASGSASASAQPSRAAAARLSAAPSPHPATHASEAPQVLGCRVIEVSGAIESAGRPLRTGAWLDGASWLILPKDGKVVVKHPTSARELSVSGPGLVRLCAAGDEQVVLARGALRATAGPGARPGAQVLVFTPVGVVRYGDADLAARVTERSVNIQVFAGDAWVEPLFGATRRGPDHVLARVQSSLTAAAAPAPERAVTACREASQAAASAAAAVLTPGQAGASLGQRAASQLKARQTARALCGSALAVLGNAPNSASARALEIGIKEADALWQKVPSGPAGPAKP
ncbi:MAG TPA: hypothetical protein VI072_23345 [Polyangiaceae bacterium]